MMTVPMWTNENQPCLKLMMTVPVTITLLTAINRNSLIASKNVESHTDNKHANFTWAIQRNVIPLSQRCKIVTTTTHPRLMRICQGIESKNGAHLRFHSVGNQWLQSCLVSHHLVSNAFLRMTTAMKLNDNGVTKGNDWGMFSDHL